MYRISKWFVCSWIIVNVWILKHSSNISIRNEEYLLVLFIYLQVELGVCQSGVCYQCSAGKYKSDLGGNDCIACIAGTYSDKLGAQSSASCLSCKSNSLSPEGSTAESACKCKPGYTGTDGGVCTPCPSGTFKGTTGSHACTIRCASQNEPSLPNLGYAHSKHTCIMTPRLANIPTCTHRQK
jgi:hypothetical protein